MKTNLGIIALILFFNITLRAQNPNVQIGGNWNEWPNEPSVCMNPMNPDQIIIGANADNYYTSNDGGETF